MSEPEQEQKNFVGKFGPLFERLRELQQRFRPGHPYVQKPARKTKRPHSHRKTKRPHSHRKAEARRKNKVARVARRRNRRQK